MQAIVSNHAGDDQRLIDVAGIEDGAIVVRPHTRQAICLKFQTHCHLIGAVAFDLFSDAELILYVMADFVRDDVGLSEIAGSLESIAKVLKEARVQIDLFIGRAIERSDSRLSKPARRIHRAGE